jgi:hypothetical protein
MPQTTVTTTPAVGVLGQFPDMQAEDEGITRSKMSTEASASIPFGVMVQKGTGDDDAKNMTANTNKLAGIVVFANNFARGSDGADAQADDNGLRPGTNFAALQVGELIVPVDESVAPGDAVRVYADDGAGHDKIPGSFCKTAHTGHTIDISPFAQWVQSGDATNPPVVTIDLRNAELAAAD